MSRVFVVGSINMDLVIKTDIVPESGMTVSGSGFMTNPGGKGANQAVAIAKSGGKVNMVGCVGKEFGAELMQTLADYGVDIGYVEQKSDISSGIAVIVVNNGDNRIILDSGANGCVDSLMAKKALSEGSFGDYLVTQLEIPVETVLSAVKEGKKAGLITVLNPAPAYALPEEIWQYVDYFIPNQSETQFYTGIYPDTVEKAAEAAKILQGYGVSNVIITLGSLGAVAFTGDNSVFGKAHKVEAVDTTAAGDTFVGALVTMLSEGKPLEYAMDYANKASSITVTRKGAQQAIPLRGEIL